MKKKNYTKDAPKEYGKQMLTITKTNQWLRSTGLKAETEGLIIAVQDQSLRAKSYFARIVKDGTSPLCRVCQKHEETVDHIISVCPELAKIDFLERHNEAAAYIHWKACQHYSIEVTERRYEHKPETVTENEDSTVKSTVWFMQESFLREEFSVKTRPGKPKKFRNW